MSAGKAETRETPRILGLAALAPAGIIAPFPIGALDASLRSSSSQQLAAALQRPPPLSRPGPAMARTKRRLTPKERLRVALASEAIARNVRTLRAGRFTQEELAFRAGLDRTLVSAIERGRHNATVVTLVALASTLEVPAQRLFERAGPPMDDEGQT